jgi:SagB-type dehydrogenase family enzyme
VKLWSDDRSPTVRLWSLSGEALVEEGLDDEDGCEATPRPGGRSIRVVTRWGEVSVHGIDPVASESLRRMRLGPVSLRNIDIPGGPDGAAAAALAAVLDTLGSAVVHSLGLPDGTPPLLSVEPVMSEPSFRPEPIAPATPVRLSRTAGLRPVAGEAMLLEVPGSAYRVRVAGPVALLVVTALAGAATVERLARQVQVPVPVVADLLSFLVAAGVVMVGGQDGRFAEDADAALAAWTQPELQMHEIGRGAPGEPVAERPVESAPAVVVRRAPGPATPLHRPDAGDPDATDLTPARQAGDADLTAEEVGELLYRASRGPGQGGARELELYVSLDRCAGLPRGIHRYDPREHALTLLDDSPGRLAAMLEVGRVGAATTGRPAAMVTITARMQLLSDLVPGVAYAEALRRCGMLQEILGLVARSMGLVAVAIAVETGGIVDRVPGLGWPAEAGLGECVIEPSAMPPRD